MLQNKGVDHLERDGIKMIATTGGSTIKKFGEYFSRTIRKGCQIHILVASKNSAYVNDLHQLQHAVGLTHDLNRELDDLVNFFRSQSASRAESTTITIGRYETQFRANMFIFDDKHCFYMPTLPPTESILSIGLEVKKMKSDGLFENCRKHFDSIWQAVEKEVIS